MYRLSQIIIALLFFSIGAWAQSPHGEAMTMDCALCHTTSNWNSITRDIPFDHNSNTNFELEGAHQWVDCASCHQSLKFEEAQENCLSCHTDVHEQSLGNNCTRCHSSENWLVFNTVELHLGVGFPLEGNHQGLSCNECHDNGNTLQFTPIGTNCTACHLDDYSATSNPNHSAAGFSTDCLECHELSTIGWGLASIDHDFFPLEKGHDTRNCTLCHDMNNYSNVSAECLSCHQNDFNSTTEPNHLSSNYPTDCASCHSTDPGWSPATFNHDFFPLSQGHDIQDCAACHTDNQYLGTDSECVSCHQNDFAATTNPNHTDAGYTDNCAVCHSTNPGWSPATINHDFFPLTQGHDIQDCTQCHTPGTSYNTTSTECVSCHQENYNATTNPNHLSSGFPTDCASCHSTSPGWIPAEINHDFFPLTLGHDIQSCNSCHVDGNFSTTSAECVSCHQENYNATTNPNHSSSGFPTDCASCHSTNPGWSPATVNHDFFPLTLGHDIQDCSSCHTDGNYNNLSTACESCHTDNYNATTNPNHTSVGFSTDCASCHTTNPGWSPAEVNHDFFPLTLGHNIQDCTQCHTDGTYSNLSSNCIDCHQTDYNTATNPNHSASAFPTDCVVCHTTNPGWQPATFDHDSQYFPIYSGEHRGEWDSCTDCHTNTADYSVFSCTICHTKNETDGEHDEVSNYVYESNACFTCHPNPD